jgi:non-homologous end joining protein Ku
MERKVAAKASATTELEFGLLKAPGIRLFKATEDKETPLAKFDGKAGPRGGRLETRWRNVGPTVDEAIPDERVAKMEVLDVATPVAAQEVWNNVLGEPGSLPDDGVQRGAAPEFHPTQERESYLVEIVGEEEREVQSEEIRRGLWVDGKFVDVTEQLESIEDQTKLDRMVVSSFIPKRNVPWERETASYFVAPAEGGGEFGLAVLALLWKVLRRTRRVGIVRWTSRSRQSLGVLSATSGGLLVHKLVWPEQARLAPDGATAVQAYAEERITAEQEAAATQLIIAMIGRGVAELDVVRDEAVVKREVLREEALAGAVTPVGGQEDQAPAVAPSDLMEALRIMQRRAA